MAHRICGCYYTNTVNGILQRTYLPQAKLDAHATVFSTASRTVLRQTFVNTSKYTPIEDIRYMFPLFDGVSVVDFKCEVGDRTIYGLVKEKAEARKTFEEAKERGENAALLEQLPDAADVFTTSISNIPGGASVLITIVYVQELKHDAEVDGIRLTIPTSISPRYGSYPGPLMDASSVNDSKGISILVDVSMADGVPIKKIVSPSHHIEISLGTLSTSTIDKDSSLSKASATLALGTTELEKDFVLQIAAKDIGIPQAILETHPTLANQRALMTTLVPKFNLKSKKPEIVFIADRSGSMQGNIKTLVSALNVFLKSIPIGCWFNICSFGSRHEFLWPKSKLYSQDTLSEAIKYVKKFGSDFGGTETLNAVRATIENRLVEMQTELVLLTDGDIWQQETMFNYVEKETKCGDVRVFPIGIGGGVSSSLIEGIARAGRGFAQMVGNGEKLDGKIVRMLKGALSPHVGDYQLEVQYDDGSVDNVAETLQLILSFDEVEDGRYPLSNEPISLYDTESKEEHPKDNESNDPFAGLPKLDRPKVLQTPAEIPPLFPFNRTCVYLLMSPETSHLTPKSVILKGTSPEGPLELDIPVHVRKEPDTMIHQLAARKAIQELEEGHGWVSNAKTEGDILIKSKYPTRLELLQRREAVRLGVEFQVGGKHCSFVAVEANEQEIAEKRMKALKKATSKISTTGNGDNELEDWEMVDPEQKQAAGNRKYDLVVTCSTSPFLSTPRDTSFRSDNGEAYDAKVSGYIQARESASGERCALLSRSGGVRGGVYSTPAASAPANPSNVYKYQGMSTLVLQADARHVARHYGSTGGFAGSFGRDLPLETLRTGSRYKSAAPGSISPGYCAKSPRYDLPGSGYSPNSPRFGATSPASNVSNPEYNPTNPTNSPTDPTYSPINLTYRPTNLTYSPTNPMYSPTSPTYSPTSSLFDPTDSEVPTGVRSSRTNQSARKTTYGLPPRRQLASRAASGRRSSRTNQPARKSTGGKPPQMQLPSKATLGTKRSIDPDLEVEENDDFPDELHPDDLLESAGAEVDDRCHKKLETQRQGFQSSSEPLSKKRKMSADVESAEEAKEDDEESADDMGFALFDDDSAPFVANISSETECKRVGKSKAKRLSAKDEETVLDRLIRLQSYEGPWSRENLPCDAMGISRDAARTTITKLVDSTDLDEDMVATILATAIVVLFLEKKLASEENTWELIVEKARDWLDDAVTSEVLAQIWKEAEGIVAK